MLASILSVQAQDFRYNLRHVTYSPRHFVDTIPLQFRNNRPCITVEIGGQQHTFLLDTGASLGELYANSHIEPRAHLGRLNSVQDAMGAEQQGDFVALPEFKLGRLTVSHFPVQQSRRQSRDGTSGSLGFALFNLGISAKIDVRSKLLILTDMKGLFKKEEGYPLPYRLYRHTPQILLQIADDWEESAVFDTGNPLFFLMSRAHWKEQSANNASLQTHVLGETRGRGLTAAHGKEEWEQITFLKLPQLQWNRYAFHNVETRTKGGPSNLGASILNHGAVIIEPKKSRLLFQPYDTATAIPVQPSCQDVYYCPSPDQRPMVGFVRPGSPYHQAGFQSGDIILNINGTEIPDFFSFQQYPFIHGRQYTFKMQHPLGIEHEASFIFRRGL